MSKELTMAEVPREIITQILFETGLDFITVLSFMQTCKLYRNIGFDGAKAFILSNYRVKNLNDDQSFLFFAMMQAINYKHSLTAEKQISNGNFECEVYSKKFDSTDIDKLFLYNTHLSALTILARNPMIVYNIWKLYNAYNNLDDKISRNDETKLLWKIMDKLFMHYDTKKDLFQSKLTGSFDSNERPIEAISWILFNSKLGKSEIIEEKMGFLKSKHGYIFPGFHFKTSPISLGGDELEIIPASLDNGRFLNRFSKYSVEHGQSTSSSKTPFLRSFHDINLCFMDTSLPILSISESSLFAMAKEELIMLRDKIDFKYKDKEGKTFVKVLETQSEQSTNFKSWHNTLIPKL